MYVFSFLRKHKRNLLIMKNLIVFLLLFSLQAHSSIFSQSKVNVDLKNSRIEELIKVIESQTQLGFLYDEDFLRNTKSITVRAKDETVENVLKAALEGTGLGYEIDHNTILIKPLPVEQAQPKKQEKKTIQGKVTDEKGAGIPGASILVKGTTNGVSSDTDGNYTLLVPESGCTLVISFVGMEAQEIKVTNQFFLNVTLKEVVSKLEDVVVTGYQTITRERATGSSVKVTGETLDQKRLGDLKTVLEGQIAGYSDGLMRGTTSMRGMTNPLFVIDGFPVENTRYNSTGSIIENLPNLNLEDIESITVLKDAAATSIYGARAANGVVVVVTRKATKEKTQVSFSSNITTSPYSYYTKNMTDAGDIIDMEKEWAAGNPNLKASAGSSGYVTDSKVNAYSLSLRNNAVYTSQGMQALLDFYSGKMTQTDLNSNLNSLGSKGYQYYKDVEKYAKRNPVYQQYNLNFGKASGKNSFNASVTYKKNKYDDIYTNDESVGINVRNSTEIASWFTLDLGSYTFYNKATNQTYSAFSPGFSYQPYNGLVDASGNAFTSTAASRLSTYTLDNINKYGLYSMNITPLDELGMNLKRKKEFSNRTFMKLNFKITDWLKYNAMFQYEYGADRTNQLKDKKSYAVRSMVNGIATVSATNKAVYSLPYGNIMYNENQYSNGYNFRQQLDFNKTLAEKHELTILLGSEVRHSKLEYADNTYYNYDTDMLSYTPVDQKTLLSTYGTILGGTYLSANNFAVQRELVNRFVSLYSNFGYSYNSKYLVTGSIRWDRSNLWGTDKKYQNKPTWSVGAGWNINKESFFDVSWIDMLKLRMSYGIGGNIAKNSAPYMTAYYKPNTNVGGMQGTINSRPNPSLSWEKTATTDLGLDFSVLKGRLNGSLDFYNKKGTNLLASTMGVPTEGWGYSTYAINNGEMTNKGLEASLRGTVVKTKDFEWNASLIYGYNKNEVTYVNVKAPVYYLQLDYGSSYPWVGESFNTIYGYKWAGLSSEGLPQVYDKDGKPISYNPADLDAIVSCGSSVPVHNGSFGSSFRYKNFELSCLFVYRAGYKLKNTNLAAFSSSYSSAAGGYIPIIGIVNKQITNSWKQPGDETKTNIPRVMYGYESTYSSGLYDIYRYADINVVDASNIRLSNVSLSYRLPSSLTQKASIQNIRLNFNIENLYTFAANKDAKYMLGGYNSPNYVFGVNLNF